MRELYGAGLADRHAGPGIVVSIQTYGNLANQQPHLHALVSAAVVNREGVFTPLALPPAGVAEELFRRRVIKIMRERGCLEDEVAAGLLAWRDSAFSVHHAIRVDPCDTEGVERQCRHIPLPGLHLTRLYGAYANRTRGSLARRMASASKKLASPRSEPDTHVPTQRARRRQWASLIAKMLEVGPLRYASTSRSSKGSLWYTTVASSTGISSPTPSWSRTTGE